MDEGLIYDVGMHDGSDTAYYLSLELRVVAVEANPALVREAKERFAREIRQGVLTVINAAVGPTRGRVELFVNESNTEHSSTLAAAGQRGGRYSTVEVERIPICDLLNEFGVPMYLKSDIEGDDRWCLDGLRGLADLPTYVSIEAHTEDYLHTLFELGYRRFKLIDQSHLGTAIGWSNANPFTHTAKYAEHNWRRVRRKILRRRERFPFGSSGPFGENTPGDWEEINNVAREWRDINAGHRWRGRHNPWGWYDFHARRG